MRVAVVANGEWDAQWGQERLAGDGLDLVICADGGGNLAISAGRIPDVLVGDLDSITPENLTICLQNNTKIVKYPREKDETDLELALAYAETVLKSSGSQEDKIDLYAAGGKRLDHLLGNIALMLQAAENNRRINMLDRSWTAWIMLPGTATIEGAPGEELSIIPLSASAVVNSKGLYYELRNLTLKQNASRGISNVLQDCRIQLQVLEGKIMLVHLKSDKRNSLAPN
jgi:thiamine pyrophosphokinase